MAGRQAVTVDQTEATQPNRRMVRVRARDVGLHAEPDLADRIRPPDLAPSTAAPQPDNRGGMRSARRLLRARVPRLESEANEPAGAQRRDRRYRRLLALADVVAITLALVVCVPLLGEGDMVTPLVAGGAPLVLVIAKVLNLYDRDELLLHKSTLDEAPKLFQVATLISLLLWLGHPALIEGELGREQMLGFWVMLAGLLPLARGVARRVARRLAPVENCLLVGPADACDRAREKIEESGAVHARVVAQVDMDASGEAEDAAATLALLAEERDVHRVVIAPLTADHGEVLNLIRAAKNLGLKVSVLPRMLEVVGSSVEFDDLEGLNVLGVRRFGLTRSSWMVKRATDIAGSALALLVLAIPLAVIAIAIKLDTRGPVFFRQQRVGRDGRLFEMLKFRTMVDGADRMKVDLADQNEADGLFKIADDPRITRIGKLLRRTSLDELPQILNVLRGEVSLVGPRPLVLEDDQRVRGWYRRRLHLTPGMTGRWQVLGSARIPLHEMVTLDYLYVANWSLWGDVKILLRTVGFVARGRGL
jgi:exopolysaccharide biosynthesis polyprenyl glycosylphosphotransferase